MKKTLPLLIILLLLLIGGAWIMIENTPTNDEDENKTVIADKNTDSQPSIQQVKEGDENKELERKEIEAPIKEQLQVKEEASYKEIRKFEQPELPSSPKTDQYKRLNQHLDNYDFDSLFQSESPKKSVVIDGKTYLVAQEIIRRSDEMTFRLLVDNTPKFQKYMQTDYEGKGCFNGDSAISAFDENRKPYLSIWKNNTLVQFSDRPLIDIGHAGNGCARADRWFGDLLLFHKLVGGSSETWSYNPATDQIQLFVAHHFWSDAPLGDASGYQIVWETPYGVYFQDYYEDNTFGDLYFIEREEFNFIEKNSVLLSKNNFVLRTNGHVAIANFLDLNTIHNLEKGLTLTINNKEVFLPW